MTSAPGWTAEPTEDWMTPYYAVNQVGRGVVIVLAPHPDDEVFGCAGAIMRHVAAGDPVHVVVVTDGGYLPQAYDGSRDRYITLRRRESLAAAAILGCPPPVFWDFSDGELVYGQTLVHRIMHTFLELRPQVIYAPSPNELHADHRALARAVHEAFQKVPDDDAILAFYEVSAPLPRPNLLLDISDIAERKREAMNCFTSQLAQNDYADYISALNRYRTYTLPKGIHTAEAYWVLQRKVTGARAPDMFSASSALVPDLGCLQQELTQHADRIRSLESDLRQARATIEGYETSRSWRMTRPLRAASTVLRRLVPWAARG